MLRQPVVAGQFYPGSATQLSRDLSILMPLSPEPIRVTGIIAPHAGYLYSGGIAGLIYGKIMIPQNILIIGPNHRGVGKPAALYPEGRWLTPLGQVTIQSRLNALILDHTPLIQPDSVAHAFEHSLEVQVPFLQHRRADIGISALCLANDSYSILRQIGEGIAAAIRAFGEEVLIVASSDMSHYEPAATARVKDTLALDRVVAFDPEGLLRTCRSERITMCGVAPAAVMLVAAKALGADRAEIMAYGTSGDITGDNREVVGYAAVAVH